MYMVVYFFTREKLLFAFSSAIPRAIVFVVVDVQMSKQVCLINLSHSLDDWTSSSSS